MVTKNTLDKVIAKAIDDGLSKDDIVVELFKDHALSLGQANKAVSTYMKEHGLVVVRRGLNAEFDDWLLGASATKPRTDAEVEKWLEENGTDNFKRHKGHYIGRGRLVARSFEKARK